MNAGGSALPSLSIFNEFVVRKNEKFPRKKKRQKNWNNTEDNGASHEAKTDGCYVHVHDVSRNPKTKRSKSLKGEFPLGVILKHDSFFHPCGLTH